MCVLCVYVLVVASRRFQVNERSSRHGYNVARVEWFDDMSDAEQDALEAQLEPEDLPINELIRNVRQMFVHELLPRLASQIPLHFLASLPPEDKPTDFAYWLATLLPIDMEEKYTMLQYRSQRERYMCLKSHLDPVIERIRARTQAAQAPQPMHNNQPASPQANPSC